MLVSIVNTSITPSNKPFCIPTAIGDFRINIKFSVSNFIA